MLVILLVSSFVSYCYCCQHLWMGMRIRGSDDSRRPIEGKLFCLYTKQCITHLPSSHCLFLVSIYKNMHSPAYTCMFTRLYIQAHACVCARASVGVDFLPNFFTNELWVAMSSLHYVFCLIHTHIFSLRFYLCLPNLHTH